MTYWQTDSCRGSMIPKNYLKNKAVILAALKDGLLVRAWSSKFIVGNLNYKIINYARCPKKMTRLTLKWFDLFEYLANFCSFKFWPLTLTSKFYTFFELGSSYFFVYTPPWLQNVLIINSWPHRIKGGKEFRAMGIKEGKERVADVIRIIT